MISILDKVGYALLPPAIRPYLTFRSVTVLILVLYAVAFFLKRFIALPGTHLEFLQAQERIFYSHTFLLVYNAALALGFFVIYLTRKHSKMYLRRVVVYGLLLAAVCGELMDLLVPWRV